MREAQSAVTQSLKLRRDALDVIAADIGQATADEETANPIETITTQMGSLYASDILWTQLASPEITDVLNDEGVDAPDLPAGNFMPENDPTQYLEQDEVTELLTGISGDTAATGGIHGLELVQTSLGDTTLDPDITNPVADDASEVTVEITNGGDSDESSVRRGHAQRRHPAAADSRSRRARATRSRSSSPPCPLPAPRPRSTS